MEKEIMLFQSQGTVSTIRTLVDGGTKINIDIPEIQADDLARLFQYNQKNIWFLMKGEKIKKDEIIKIPDVPMETGQKTPSQRLRSRMFVYYQETHTKTEGFNDWYSKTLNNIGQSYLEKINEKS